MSANTQPPTLPVHPARTSEPCSNNCKGCGCSADAAREAAAPATPAAIPVIHKILVAVDHPHHPAVNMALALAAPLHAEVAVVHAFDAASMVNSESAYSYTQEIDQLRADSKRIVSEIERELPERAKAFTALREGNPATEILAAAHEWRADLIIMGTHRRSAIARALLGSTSQAVLRHGTCPVMFVDDQPA